MRCDSLSSVDDKRRVTFTTLKTLVVAIGAGLGVWGVVNLLEGYITGIQPNEIVI